MGNQQIIKNLKKRESAVSDLNFINPDFSSHSEGFTGPFIRKKSWIITAK